jgi:hypothetical protein
MQLNIKELFKALQRERGIAPEVLHEALEAAMASTSRRERSRSSTSGRSSRARSRTP